MCVCLCVCLEFCCLVGCNLGFLVFMGEICVLVLKEGMGGGKGEGVFMVDLTY